MTSSGRQSRLVALLTALIACVGLLSLSTAPAWAKAGTITEFPVAPGLGGPQFITAGPDGNLWFTAGNAIGRITTGGSFTAFPLPMTCGSSSGCEPDFITAGPDGNLWVTEVIGNQIGRISTTGHVTEFPIPTKSSVPISITAGPDGNLWVTLVFRNAIDRITTTGLVTGGFFLPTTCQNKFGCRPLGITAGPDGNLWFTESSGGKIGRITPQ